MLLDALPNLPGSDLKKQRDSIDICRDVALLSLYRWMCCNHFSASAIALMYR
ncbi:MAG: hypothetical protein HC903_08885 [Methylacidiphilales bacterium]|nr:hypothetical protein [Candidatus Methylacidiphilales bacterium]